MLSLDADFLKTNFAQHGSTCVFALVRPTDADPSKFTVTVTNVGDSRCLWISPAQSQVLFSTSDHKPQNPSEDERIRAAGGHVAMDRVDGELAVARAIGDAKYKQASHKSPSQQKVCAVPDVSHFTASAGDILFVACDGLFEKLSNEELTARLVVELGKFPNDPALVASAMLHASLEAGSRDNMSAIVIQFTDGTGYTRADEFVAGPFYQWSSDPRFRRCYERDADKAGMSGLPLYEKAFQASVDEMDRALSELKLRAEGNSSRLEELSKQRSDLLQQMTEAYQADQAAAASK